MKLDMQMVLLIGGVVGFIIFKEAVTQWIRGRNNFISQREFNGRMRTQEQFNQEMIDMIQELRDICNENRVSIARLEEKINTIFEILKK